MKKRSFIVSIEIDVWDAAALRRQAAAKARESMTAKEWQDMRRGEGFDIGAELQMLLDPGLSPDGCEIIQSGVEEYRETQNF